MGTFIKHVMGMTREVNNVEANRNPCVSAGNYNGEDPHVEIVGSNTT